MVMLTLMLMLVLADASADVDAYADARDHAGWRTGGSSKLEWKE